MKAISRFSINDENREDNQIYAASSFKGMGNKRSIFEREPPSTYNAEYGYLIELSNAYSALIAQIEEVGIVRIGRPTEYRKKLIPPITLSEDSLFVSTSILAKAAKDSVSDRYFVLLLKHMCIDGHKFFKRFVNVRVIPDKYPSFDFHGYAVLDAIILDDCIVKIR